VTFDPTPGVAVSALGPRGVASSLHGGRARVASPSERVSGNGTGGLPATDHRRRAPVAVVAGAGLLVLLLAATGWAALGWRRRRGRRPPDLDPALAELQRALRRTGRAPAPHATLATLERNFRDSPEAAAYVRALAASRYGYGHDAPTASQRRALRAELARGLGTSGRVRALWALPPWSPRRRVGPRA
jgi:hypothetical protein